MSDDLISRKAVIESVDRHTRDDGTLDDDISVILEEVETAFDKEKVIEELKSPCNYTIMAGKHFTTVDRSVKIVEKGGIECY